jgi:hypothetical protein
LCHPKTQQVWYCYSGISAFPPPKKRQLAQFPRRDKKNARPLLEEERAMGFQPTVSQLLFMALKRVLQHEVTIFEAEDELRLKYSSNSTI